MISNKRNGKLIVLDTERKGAGAHEFEAELSSRVIGQDRAVRAISSLYQIFHAGLTNQSRPIGTMLFLGPTGSGKTRVVEAAAEALFGTASAVIKIDCAEFQHSHEIAKLIGSPPGYLGHRETSPLLTQANLDLNHTKQNPFTLVLFDEIEKASDALWQLLLGVLDKAVLTLGDNTRVNFSQTMIFMTSNLGAKEISELITGSIGFAPARGTSLNENDLDQKLYRTAREAARRRFSPEFLNRIDKLVVFRSLERDELRRILDLELDAVQRRVDAGPAQAFTFTLTDQAKDFILSEGIDYRYGARHLKRAIERHLVYPLASLSGSRQARPGDVVVVDIDQSQAGLVFFREGAARVTASLEAAQAVETDTNSGRVAA